jgi:hypothetical protein
MLAISITGCTVLRMKTLPLKSGILLSVAVLIVVVGTEASSASVTNAATFKSQLTKAATKPVARLAASSIKVSYSSKSATSQAYIIETLNKDGSSYATSSLMGIESTSICTSPSVCWIMTKGPNSDGKWHVGKPSLMSNPTDGGITAFINKAAEVTPGATYSYSISKGVYTVTKKQAGETRSSAYSFPRGNIHIAMKVSSNTSGASTAVFDAVKVKPLTVTAPDPSTIAK